MRILLDENMPPQFRHNFPEDDVRSAQFMGWLGHHNGELEGVFCTINLSTESIVAH